MSTEFTDWAGIDAVRWAQLQDRLRDWAQAERTPARILKCILTDGNVGYREGIVLAYWLGYLQGSRNAGKSVELQDFTFVSGMN